MVLVSCRRQRSVRAWGLRYIDRLVNGLGYKAKAGVDVGLMSSIKLQVLKDAELVATGQLQGAEWYFFQGAKPEPLDFLKQNGIGYVVYP